MIASFFRNLEAHEVAYLLINGQATVLYGAATFSEDIDLWLAPEPENVERFRAALRESGAHYYKLTPPLEPAHLEAGHGFHFLLEATASAPVFLDVIGRPPRTREFSSAWHDSRRFTTDWGTLPTVDLRDLIEIKKTQRPADYPIISALTLRILGEAEPSAETLAWATSNLFTLEAFFSFNEKYPTWIDATPATLPPALTQFAGRHVEEVPSEVLESANQWMAATMSRLQLADRVYWANIIAQLRALRTNGQLAPEGAPV
ncbi:hypothetical protein BH20VER1_BH20VER1_01520 [soil metagenome]